MMLEPHPLNLVFRDMTEEEFTALVEDIGAHGLRRPVVLFEGKILDGRHRYRACLEIKERDPATRGQIRCETFVGSWREAEAYVWSENFQRRHLSQTEKACLALEWIEKQGGLPGRGGDRRSEKAAKSKRDGVALKEMATIQFAVHPRTIEEVAQVKAARPDLFDVMRQGGIGLREAQREIKGQEESRPAKMDQGAARQIICPSCGTVFDV